MKLTIKLISYTPLLSVQEVGAMEVDVDPSIMVGDLRRQLSSSYELTVFVTSGGKEMKSNQTLTDWRIQEGATLYSLVK